MQIIKITSKLVNRFRLRKKWSHLNNIKTARKVEAKLQEIKARQEAKKEDSFPLMLGYLRKIGPDVFEELILNVIEDSNLFIRRNLRYTGDGGIDGIFWLRFGCKVLIQAKRYSDDIKAAHVTDLCEKVKQKKCQFGIFVHTGKTGPTSKKVIEQHKNVVFISGGRLTDFLTGKINMKDFLEKHIARNVDSK